MVNVFGCIDIIIRRDSLEKKEKGLSQKLIDDYELDERYYDDKIICIPGGMNPYDVEQEVVGVEKEYGIVFNPYIDKEPETDMVIVEGWGGIRTKNKWLKEKNETLEDGRFCRQYYFIED